MLVFDTRCFLLQSEPNCNNLLEKDHVAHVIMKQSFSFKFEATKKSTNKNINCTNFVLQE